MRNIPRRIQLSKVFVEVDGISHSMSVTDMSSRLNPVKFKCNESKFLGKVLFELTESVGNLAKISSKISERRTLIIIVDREIGKESNKLIVNGDLWMIIP